MWNLLSSEEDLHILIPTKTYSRMPITSLTEEPIPIQPDTSLSSVLFPDQSLIAETNIFSKEGTFHLACTNECAFDEELRTINLHTLLPVHKARHSLGLD
jgi:hypothetical protein